jgi:peptide/nickel transport system permease protein
MAIELLTAGADLLHPGLGTDLRKRFLGHLGIILGSGIVVFVVLVALLAPWLAPHDPYSQDLSQRLIPPVWHDKGSWSHVLGTDQLGRDYLSRLIFGSRISVMVGVTAATMAAVIGTSLGVVAGYFGGRIDLLITFIITTRLAMPVVLVALAVAAFAGSSVEIVIAVLGLLLWDRFAVVTRSATMQVRALDYVAAARTIGCSTGRIILAEILPNIANVLVVVATLEVAQAILLEATLSFLGLGVPPPLPSWGLMVAEGKEYMFFSPWVITIPGIALFTLVLAINLLGDGLRDLSAPENRA